MANITCEFHEKGAGYPACGRAAYFVVTYLQGATIKMCDKHARRAAHRGRKVRQLEARTPPTVANGGAEGST